jgi:hypothetical protein
MGITEPITKGAPALSHTPPAEHGSSAGTPPVISTAQWEAFRTEDKSAAANIVFLMTGIFIAGLIGYLVVAIVVAG